MNAKNITQRSLSKKGSAGFTLIELIMVVMILGVLAAVALPKFVDLSDKAAEAAVKGVAGAISSGTAGNFAARKVGMASAITLDSPNICTANLGNQKYIGNVLQGNEIPAGYVLTGVSGSDDCSDAGVDTAKCNVTHTATGKTAVAMVYCAR